MVGKQGEQIIRKVQLGSIASLVKKGLNEDCKEYGFNMDNVSLRDLSARNPFK